mgnify:CR=1 FL=1
MQERNNRYAQVSNNLYNNRSFQEKCIYVKLNIGISGKITNKSSIKKIISQYSPGDILLFNIIKYDITYDIYILDLQTVSKFVLNQEAKVYFPKKLINNDKETNKEQTKLSLDNITKYNYKSFLLNNIEIDLEHK